MISVVMGNYFNMTTLTLGKCKFYTSVEVPFFSVIPLGKTYKTRIWNACLGSRKPRINPTLLL